VKFLNNIYLVKAGEGDGGSGGNGGTGDGDDTGDGDGDTGDGDGNADTGDSGGDGGTGDGGGGGAVGFYDGLPDDWRDQIGGKDEGRLNDLNRYTSLEKWVESGFEAKDKIRKGEVSTGLPKDPTDEQLATYREANDIPLTSEYKLSLEPGVELSDMEQEIMKGVMEVAHISNVPQSTLSAITGAWIANKNVQLQRMADQDGLDAQEGERLMRDHWKHDYDKNMGAVTSLLNGIPEEERKMLVDARDGEGKPLMSRPYFLQFLADSALKINPMALMPGGGSDPMGTADAIINKVKAIFAAGNEKTEYYRNKKLQADYEKALELKQQAGQKV